MNYSDPTQNPHLLSIQQRAHDLKRISYLCSSNKACPSCSEFRKSKSFCKTLDRQVQEQNVCIYWKKK